ncbi:serine protease 27-like isoform 1-T2 [Liasis olivaceus]
MFNLSSSKFLWYVFLGVLMIAGSQFHKLDWPTYEIFTNGVTNQECGQPRTPRIVGGQDATKGKWPWQVSILENNTPICGGSVISDQWVLSAAHCFYDAPDHEYTAVLGAYQLLNLSRNEVFAAVKKIVLHPDYNGKSSSLGDIALIQLQKPVNFTNSIIPICLPTPSEKFSGEADCWVTGWGTIKEKVNLPPPLTLQEVKVPLISQRDCSLLYNQYPVPGLGKGAIKHNMICAGSPNSGKDSCQGDSGGPLACQLQGRWTQAGIVSWGIGCANKLYPGVYTSVPFYADWIKTTMEGRKNGGLQNVPALVVLLLSLGLVLL